MVRVGGFLRKMQQKNYWLFKLKRLRDKYFAKRMGGKAFLI